MKKKNLREGKKTAVTEEDIPTPETENLRYVGPVTRKRARDAGDDIERVTLDKLRKVNAAGTNKSAAAGSTSLNTKRLHEDTENLAFNAAGTNKSVAVGRISLKTKRPDTGHDWQCSGFPPRPAEADDDWICYRVGTSRKDAKEVRCAKTGCVLVKEDNFDFEYVWEKREVVPVKLRTKKLSKAALAMRRKRFQI